MTLQQPFQPRLGGRRSGRGSSIQGRMRDESNDRYATKYACARCRISYDVPEGMRAQCPLCKAQTEVDQLRQALLEAQNKLELQTNELNRLRPQVDLVAAMRGALEVIGPEDLTFLKSVAYRHREGASVSLKVTLGRRGRRTAPNGFLAVFRSDQMESHECTSIGGLALASYVFEGLSSFGPLTTLQHLMRAMSDHLKGAT